MNCKLILKPRRDEAILRFHPWVFSGAIADVEGNPKEGDVVDVYSNKGDFLARGHFQIGSIECRILTFEDEPIDDNFWFRRISNAFALREKLNLADNTQTTAYRLIHGEGDMLAGLIVDIYGNTAVMQAHSAGMYLQREVICKTLQKILGKKLTAVYDKSSATVPFKANLDAKDEYLFGSGSDEVVLEYGKKFCVNWEEGQKTGFFLDQRENRKLLELYTNGASVLNTFCYTGGFSVSALRGGATLVHSVDSSQKAIELTDQNVALNFGTTANHKSFAEDAFEFIRKAEQTYDVIILDPPAFAKHNAALKNALQAYKRLNVAALSKLNKNGILFTFSCSQVVNKENFRNAVFSAAAISKRNVRILHQLSQPADHPINIYHPEGEYLKGLVLYVE